jgi:hypothetical protein
MFNFYEIIFSLCSFNFYVLGQERAVEKNKGNGVYELTFEEPEYCVFLFWVLTY